jgi:addiction module HigA family antidote
VIGPLPPVHPGEILNEEFLVPLSLSPDALSAACRVPRSRIDALIRGDEPVTADTALRLARVFRTGPEFWMNLQSNFDLATAADASPEIQSIEPLFAA